MTERQDLDRPSRQEDEYFHRRDRELVEKARLAEVAAREREGLAAALGVDAGDLTTRLHAMGFTADNVWLLEWLPAIHVGWLKGLERAERDWLLERIRASRAQIGDAAMSRLDEWLTKRPDEGLLQLVREALRARLAALGGDERDALRSTVFDSARGVSAASGGVLGMGRVSAEERAALDDLARDLGEPA
jgi:hypothetical protein